MQREEQDSSGAEWSFDCGCLLVSSKFNSFCFGSENFICVSPRPRVRPYYSPWVVLGDNTLSL